MSKIFFGDKLPAIEDDVAKEIFDRFEINFFLGDARVVSKDWKRIVDKREDTTKTLLRLLNQCSSFQNQRPSNIINEKKLAGGLTNTTFAFEAKQFTFNPINKKLIARKPGKDSEKFINRKDEAFNAKLAAEIQVGPKVIFTDSKGIQISEFLENATPMDAQLLKDKKNLEDVTDALKTLHTCGRKFANDIDVFARNKKMLSLLAQHQIQLSDDYMAIIQQLYELEEIFQLLQIEKVPCHNDTTPGNFLKSNGQIKLIDLEYAGNNDPIWDLACLSMEARFSQEQDLQMLAHYCSRWNEEIYQRFLLYKPVVEFWTALWYQVQIANNNLQISCEDLQKNEHERFQACKNLLDSVDFKDALQSTKSRLKAEKAGAKKNDSLEEVNPYIARPT